MTRSQSTSPMDGELDMSTVLKALQAISAEIDLSKLLTILMEIMIENAGAQHGLLVLRSNGRLFIEASARVDAERAEVKKSVPIDSTIVPESIVRYVVRTGERVLLADATTSGLFAGDGYVRTVQPRSVLCVPLSLKKRSTGAIYLENNLTTHAFSESRVRVVEILLAQAAISLENARLYDDLAQEITERRRAEEALSALNQELEERVELRTAALRASQEELVKKERLASLGEITATVSHELRNPLGALLPALFLIRKRLGGTDKTLEAAVERMERNIWRCDRIIDEVLDFTRSQQLDLRPTVADQWLSDVLDELEAPVGVDVRRQLTLGQLSLEVDQSRLRRAVVNVFENACDAMTADESLASNGKAQVTLRSRRTDSRVEIEISDTGPGIAPDVLPRIFEPLFSTKGFGVGLGLPAVKQILEQHRGGVEVENKLERGTRFLLWLPLGSERSGSDDLKGGRSATQRSGEDPHD